MPALGHEDDDQDLDQNQNTNVEDPNDDTDTAQQNQAEDPSVPAVIEDDGEHEDERLSERAEDDDEGAHDDRPRQRETAKERRKRAKEAKERDKLELQILRDTVARQNDRISAIQRDTTVTRVSELDTRLATALAEVEQFEKIQAAAITAKNGTDAMQAQKLAEQARQRAWAIHNEKEGIQRQQQQQTQNPIKPYADKAVNFLKDKPWYNPNATSVSDLEDTLVVEALDKVLMRSMDPNDPRYWSTLETKVRAKLPHRFDGNTPDADDEGQDDDNDAPAARQDVAPRRKGPPTGGSSRTNSGRGLKEIRLPKEMVDAMKEAGQWDNPKQRARVAQRYIDGLRNRG